MLKGEKTCMKTRGYFSGYNLKSFCQQNNAGGAFFIFNNLPQERRAL